MFIVSRVEVRAAAGGPETIEVEPAEDLGLRRCPRCWRSVPALVPRPGPSPYVRVALAP